MKNLLSIPILSVIFFMTYCRKKEEIILSPVLPPTVIIPPIIAENPFIKEFLLNSEVKATISTLIFDNGDTLNQIIMILPETFVGDEISPIIKLTDDAESISPKSGEKVFFEGKPPVEYTLTKKDGKIEKYFLYVQCRGELKAELLTKELTIEPSEYNTLRIRLLNMGTLSKPNYPTENGNYQLEPYSSDVKQRFEFSGGMGMEPNSNIFRAAFLIRKSGEISVKVFSTFPQSRKSNSLKVSLVKGKKVFITFPLVSFINGSMNYIDGMNIDPNINYTVRLTNDFISKAIEYQLNYVDDVTLGFYMVEKLANVGYTVSLYENGNFKFYSEIALKGNQENFVPFQTNFKKVSPLNDYPKPYELNEKLTFKPGGNFIAFEWAFTSVKGDLKLINYETKKEYLLKGESSYCCDGSITYRIFTLPETIPVGDYEVYGIKEGETSARYSRKLEIIK